MLDAYDFNRIIAEFEDLTKSHVSEDSVNNFLKAHHELPEQVYDLFLGKYWLDLREENSNNSLEKARFHLDSFLNNIRDVKIKEFPEETYLPQAYSNGYSFAGMLYSILGNAELALRYYKCHQYISLQYSCGVSYKDMLGVRLFSFRQNNQHVLSDLINREITVCRPQMMNDPFDSIYTLWAEHYDSFCKEKKHVGPFKKSFEYFYIRSFIKESVKNPPYKDILMWSHYADGHRGFCIEYQFSNEFIWSCLDNKIAMRFHDILYTDDAVVIDNKLNSVLGFYTKQSCWKKENEERLLAYIPEADTNVAHIPLDPHSFIKAIYFGFKFPEKDRKTIMHILGKNVQYFKMTHDLSDVYKLSEEQIFSIP